MHKAALATAVLLLLQMPARAAGNPLNADLARLLGAIPTAQINTEPRTKTLKALELISQNRFEDASAQMNAALQLDPSNSYVQFFNAFAYHMLAQRGDTQKLALAEQGYTLAVQFDRSNWIAHYFLGLLHFEQRSFAEAQRELAEVLLFREDDPEVLFRMVAASYYAGDPVTAAACLDRLRLLKPSDPQILRLSAIISAAIGNADQAGQWLSQYAASGPAAPELSRARERVAHWGVVHRNKPARSSLLLENGEVIKVQATTPLAGTAGSVIRIQASTPANLTVPAGQHAQNTVAPPVQLGQNPGAQFAPQQMTGVMQGGSGGFPQGDPSQAGMGGMGGMSGMGGMNSAGGMGGMGWMNSAEGMSGMGGTNSAGGMAGMGGMNSPGGMGGMNQMGGMGGDPSQGGMGGMGGMGRGMDMRNSQRMVLVDVVIMRTEDSLASHKGINLLNALTLQFGGSAVPGFSRNFSTTTTGEVAATTTVLTRAINIPALTYSLNIVNSSANLNEVLARPTLAALEGMKSEFFSGSNLNAAVVSTGANGGSAVQIEKEIGVKLTILPQFISDNKIRLAVDAQRTFLKPPSQDIGFTYKIEVSKIMVNANVVMEFGETLVLGGLSEKETTHARDGVPFLQDVPGVQYLFGRRDISNFQRSVLMLITPRKPQYAYRSEEALRAASSDKAGDKADKSDRGDSDSLKELRARYGDWFKPYPNMASVFSHLNTSSIYREFRTGDVTLEKWDKQDTTLERLRQALDFLFY